MNFDNDVTIEIYDGTTKILDVSGDLDFAENVEFTTHIPGGDYGEASFFVERDITEPLAFEIGHRVNFLHGQTIVYEGFISGINRIVEADYQGIEFLCLGPTDWILMRYPLEKKWADDSIGDQVWVQQTAGIDLEDWIVDRQGRIHINPGTGAFASGDYTALRYTMPVGQTIKRLFYAYDMLEKAGQSWEMSMWRSTDGITFTQMTNASGETYSVGTTTVIVATGTGTVNVTLATPSRYLELRYYARGNNNPVNSDHNHAVWTSLAVFSETDNPITMTTIAQDCAAEVSAAGYINSSTSFIATPSTQLTLEPFVTNGYPSIADILNDAVGRGDGAFNRYIWGMRQSGQVGSSDGKPVLYLRAYPLTTDWEYEVSLGDENIASGIDLLQDGAAIVNHIIASRGDINGNSIYITPTDDANFEDATSKSTYRVLSGVRLDTGDCSLAEATAYVKRFKATYKDPPFRLLRPLVLVDYIRTKFGNEVPVRRVKSGERIRINDFVSSPSGISPVFVISSISHSVANGLISITTGVPGAPIGARQIAYPVSAPPDDATSGTSTTASGTSVASGKMKFNWWERYYKASGRARGLSIKEAKVEWNTMEQGKRNKWKKNDWKAWKKAKSAPRAKK